MHWQVGKEKICVEFRQWLETLKHQIEDIPEGTFRSEGALLLHIQKPHNAK